MKTPEDRAWTLLRERASARIHPGFADQVLAAARSAIPPSPAAQFMLGAATAVLCFLAVALIQSQSSRAEESHNLAGWQQILSSTDDAGLGQ